MNRAVQKKHGNWISAPAASYDPYASTYSGPGRVGASASGYAELGKQGIVVTDEVVKDLNVPVMATALELMDQVFAIADTLGIGAEVRAGVYAIRGATYAGTTASAALGISAGAGLNAAGATFAGIGGAAALGAIGVVAAIGFALFGGGDSSGEDAKRKKAQTALLRLRDRLTIAELAAEQDAIWPPSLAPPTPAAAQAQKLAAFYRKVGASVDKAEAALFESLSNMARWYAARDAYRKMGQTQKDAVDELWGKSAPRTEYQLSHAMAAELPKLESLVRAAQAGRDGAPGFVTIALLALAAAGGLYAGVNPAGAASLARSAGSKVTGAARYAVSKVRRVTP